MASWRELPGPARILGGAISGCVDAAASRDRAAYESASAELGPLADGAGEVLGALVRSLLEDQHTDGLDSDDIQLVLGRCYREAAGWLPADRIEVSAMLAVLASALGIHEPGVTYEEITGPADPAAGDDWAGDPVGGTTYGGASSGGASSGDASSRGASSGDVPGGTVPSRVPTAAGYAWHAPLLIADLLAAGRRPLRAYLDAAFAEIARAETMEMP